MALYTKEEVELQIRRLLPSGLQGVGVKNVDPDQITNQFLTEWRKAVLQFVKHPVLRDHFLVNETLTYSVAAGSTEFPEFEIDRDYNPWRGQSGSTPTLLRFIKLSENAPVVHGSNILIRANADWLEKAYNPGGTPANPIQPTGSLIYFTELINSSGTKVIRCYPAVDNSGGATPVNIDVTFTFYQFPEMGDETSPYTDTLGFLGLIVRRTAGILGVMYGSPEDKEVAQVLLQDANDGLRDLMEGYTGQTFVPVQPKATP